MQRADRHRSLCASSNVIWMISVGPLCHGRWISAICFSYEMSSGLFSPLPARSACSIPVREGTIAVRSLRAYPLQQLLRLLVIGVLRDQLACERALQDALPQSLCLLEALVNDLSHFIRDGEGRRSTSATMHSCSARGGSTTDTLFRSAPEIPYCPAVVFAFAFIILRPIFDAK